MFIRKMTVGPFEMNSYICADDRQGHCILIDPGDEPHKIIKTVEEENLIPEMIINTHNHIDHVRHLSIVQKHFDIPFYFHAEDSPLLSSLEDQGLLFGLDVSPPPEVGGYLVDKQQISLGDLTLQVLHTPGHSPGSISILASGHVFVGDVLFKDSVGRTDLYGGDYTALMRSIQTQLMVLPDDTQVYAGHGPNTTIGREKTANPFLSDRVSSV